MERSELRGLGFSEAKWQWKLDLDDSNFVTGIAAGKGMHTTACTSQKADSCVVCAYTDLSLHMSIVKAHNGVHLSKWINATYTINCILCLGQWVVTGMTTWVLCPDRLWWKWWHHPCDHGESPGGIQYVSLWSIHQLCWLVWLLPPLELSPVSSSTGRGPQWEGYGA